MDEAQKNDLVRQAMPMIEALVRRNHARFYRYATRDEIRSFALHALAEAIARFDPNKGVPISTFAEPRVQGAIFDGITAATHLPRRLMRQIRFVRQYTELQPAGSPPPSADTVETAHRLAASLKDLVCAYVVTVSNPEPPPAAEEPPPTAHELFERAEFLAAVREAVHALPDDQRAVILAYFWGEKSLADLAAETGLSRSGVRRRIQVALSALRPVLKRRLGDYIPRAAAAPPPPRRRATPA